MNFKYIKSSHWIGRHRKKSAWFSCPLLFLLLLQLTTTIYGFLKIMRYNVINSAMNTRILRLSLDSIETTLIHIFSAVWSWNDYRKISIIILLQFLRFEYVYNIYTHIEVVIGTFQNHTHVYNSQKNQWSPEKVHQFDAYILVPLVFAMECDITLLPIRIFNLYPVSMNSNVAIWPLN